MKLDFVLQKLKDPRIRTLSIALAAMLMLIVFVEFWPAHSTQSSATESADTYIPAGFVLVPIDLQNAESLSSLIGEFAVVDLFTGLGQQQHRVGRSLKLIRAPLNPGRLAVFVPDSQVAALLRIPGPYWAVLQNPNSKMSASIDRDKKYLSKVEYFDGGSR